MAGVAAATSAQAAIFLADFTQEDEFQPLGNVGIGDGIAARGLIEGTSFDNRLVFNLTQTANLSVSSTWFAKSIFANSFDLVLSGSNVRVDDGDGDFNDTTETVSSILIAANLAPGIYELRATGDIFGQAGNYDYKVEVTPIPTAVALLGTALAGLAVVGIRRRKTG